MKIALFIKPSIIKVSFSLLLFLYIVALPNHALASFFSDLITKVFGSETQSLSIVSPNEDVHNSQNVPLLESSINPDLKNIQDEPILLKDETVLSNDGALGVDSELEKYDSSTKIITYTVKKGDTLEEISKDLKVSQDSIISSNADLKKSDLLKIGQKLVIFTLKSTADDKAAKKEDTITKKDEKKVAKAETPVEKVPAKEEAPKPVEEVKVVVPPPQSAPQPEITNTIPVVPEVQAQPEGPSGQNGTIDGGYIWPFPAGTGRVSQGRHGDNAYDFSAPKGTPIYAVQSGTVFIAHPTGYNGGYGLYVVINFDDGRQAIFGHMSKVLVEEGQVVKQGEVIGLVGSTGKSTGPHVHIGFHGELSNPYLGLKKNSTSIDHD
jgi:murein DD-endopeptidase MepM/ murein hydrolase activator NlpD